MDKFSRWNPELTKMWRMRFEAIRDEAYPFHNFIKLTSTYEALGALQLAIDEIERLSNETSKKG